VLVVVPHIADGMQVMINETKQDLENLRVDMQELEDLRVMRQDIQRQEKANAELISSQAKRLEELETLYKEEQVLLPQRCLKWLLSPLCTLAASQRCSQYFLYFGNIALFKHGSGASSASWYCLV
jgi:hypothetical protein